MATAMPAEAEAARNNKAQVCSRLSVCLSLSAPLSSLLPPVRPPARSSARPSARPPVRPSVRPWRLLSFFISVRPSVARSTG